MDLSTHNLNQLNYFIHIFITERRLNNYVLIRASKFMQLCRIYRRYGERHVEFIKRIIQNDKPGIGN